MNIFNSNIGRRAFKLSVGVLALAGATQLAQAGIIPYDNPGTENPAIYTFTATASGDVMGYFAGSGASWDESVGLLVNGILTPAGFGLDDHSSSVGDSFDFGSVTAGDTLTFVDMIISGPLSNPTPPAYVYSDPTLNGPFDGGHNHVYSTTAAAGQISSLIPAGTYVAFEDEPASYSDFNYFDDTFVFTDTTTTETVVPEATTVIAGVLMLLPLGVGTLRMLRKTQKA